MDVKVARVFFPSENSDKVYSVSTSCIFTDKNGSDNFKPKSSEDYINGKYYYVYWSLCEGKCSPTNKCSNGCTYHKGVIKSLGGKH